MVEISLGIIAVCALIYTSLVLVRETLDRDKIAGENPYANGEKRVKKGGSGGHHPKTPAARAQKWLDDRKGGMR